MTVSAELEREARAVSIFRDQVKEYLESVGACYDKFTITDNDTILGYISEMAIRNHLENKYGELIEIWAWADHFNMSRIQAAVTNRSTDKEEIAYVKAYFYDKYDLEIIEKRSNKRIYVDVKTAETAKRPTLNWDFLYPVVQNQREGKDFVVLCYYYKAYNRDKQREKKIILVGYMSEEEISQKEILKAGEKTKFGTVNQIDNYETKMEDYQELHRMLNIGFGHMRCEKTSAAAGET